MSVSTCFLGLVAASVTISGLVADPRELRLEGPEDALSGLPQVSSSEGHVARSGRVEVRTRWRSERALAAHAEKLAEIGDAAVSALGLPASDAVLRLEVFESPADLRKALRSSAGTEPGGGRGPARKGGRRAEVQDDSDSEGDTSPITVRRGGEGTWVAASPKVHDRVLFGTGIQPSARWAVAIEAAWLALEGLESSPDWMDPAARRAARALRAAHLGQHQLGLAAATPAEEPYLSSGLQALKEQLDALPEADRAPALLRIAGEPPLDHVTYPAIGPFAASAADMARWLLSAQPFEERAAAIAHALEELAAHAPRWQMEGGNLGVHPFGWQIVAPRRSDALVLSARPMGERPFTIKTRCVAYSNRLGPSAQADVVLGDVDGSRYLLVCNSGEGVYLFHRSGPDAPYETVTEFKEIPIPVGQAVPIEIRWDGAELAIRIAGADIPKQRLSRGALAGRIGFGAHAGCTALFSPPEIE